jgi:hypothetical protein
MRIRLARVVGLIFVFALPGLAQQAISVEKLVEFIKSSVTEKLPDKEVAAQLVGYRLTSKLEDRVIEDLQHEGAGPRTVAALTKLADQSAKLVVAAPKPAAPKPVETPPPSQDFQQAMLAQIREYALSYAKSLPDFICIQLTRRSVDLHYQPGSPGRWSPADKIVEKLSYFDQQEKYEPISVNETAMIGKSWQTLGGSISRGEFGSLLRDVFEPQTDAIFVWDHWGALDKKLAYVFRYTVLQPHSRYSVDYEKKDHTVPGYHGLVFVQKSPNPDVAPYVITRMTIEPDMPEGFPVQEIHQQIDYKTFEINGRQYLLPMTSQVQSRSGSYGSRNEIQFLRYQKYSADTTIKFDDSDDPAQPEQSSPDQKKPDDVKKTPPAPKP